MRRDGLDRLKAECVWEAAALPTLLDPAIRRELHDFVEATKRDGIPVAPTAMPFKTDVAVRPKGHRRAFYVPLADTQGRGPGYVAIKGTEPRLVDQMRLLASTGFPLAWHERHMSAIDVFPITEHKVPMLLTTTEALDEATISQELYSTYVARYGEIPYLPLPLAVFKLPHAVVDEFVGVLRPLLSPFAEQIVDRLLIGGASCYLYYYPVAPFPRVRHFAEDLRNAGSERLAKLSGVGDPVRTIDRWLTLFTRLLALGYLPATPSQTVTGQAVQAQNTIVGGGFVDLDSVRRITDIGSTGDFLESYCQSVCRLANTVTVYLINGASETMRYQASDTMSLLYFYERFADAVAREIEGGSSFDARLAALPPFNRTGDGWLNFAKLINGLPSFQALDKILRGELPS